MSSKTSTICIVLLISGGFQEALVSGEVEIHTIALGSVDGKTYFVNDYHRSYTKSRAYCEWLGMSIATITSEAQATFLKSMYDPTYFNGWYWLGARDLDNDGKFHWSNSLKQVQTFSNIKWSDIQAHNIYEDGQRQCLCCSSNNHISSYYFKRSCHHEHYTLCESNNPMKEIPPHFKQITRESQEFIKLGTFDGKAYYGDADLRTWSESNQFCSKKGLNWQF